MLRSQTQLAVLTALLLLVLITFEFVSSNPPYYDDDMYHPLPAHASARQHQDTGAGIENGIHQIPFADWNQIADATLAARLQRKYNTKKAKNIIFVLGDGMGVSTLQPARVHKSQDSKITLDKVKLAWDEFLDTGMVKTYNSDAYVPDSAGTAVAFMCGIKTREGVIGVNENVKYADNCTAVPGNECKSALHHAMDEGKWAGIVTTARVTHATPACAYAHTTSRLWESDSEVPAAFRDHCPDIAKQLIHEPINQDIRVVMGGGRRHFLLRNTSDPESGTGRRYDMDLVKEWKRIKRDTIGIESKFSYITNQSEFDAIDPAETDYLLGLFENSHMRYEADRQDDIAGEPSLAEMVEKSINILSRSDNGYFLYIEGGRIDHAHHGTRAQKALRDTWALSDAVQKALDMTSEEDTLIVVTADHSHVFTMGGYNHIDNDLYGLVVYTDGRQPLSSRDGFPYFGLAYGNGPGQADHRQQNNDSRINMTTIEPEQYNNPDFRQDTAVQLSSETHGGEDVGVFAHGPWSHLFIGTVEQHYLARAMKFAGCLDSDTTQDHCTDSEPQPGSANYARTSSVMGAIIMLLWAFLFI